MDSELIQKAVLTISTDAPADQVAEVKMMIDRLGEVARDLKRQFEAQAIAWIQANGDLTIGDKRYYVGESKNVKCRDTKAALELLLNATDGAVDAIADVMVAQPFKHGACRNVLSESDYARAFMTVVDVDLKTGAPKKEVKCIDPAFIKPRI